MVISLTETLFKSSNSDPIYQQETERTGTGGTFDI
jgi:hypothetical protein